MSAGAAGSDIAQERDDDYFFGCERTNDRLSARPSLLSPARRVIVNCSLTSVAATGTTPDACFE